MAWAAPEFFLPGAGDDIGGLTVQTCTATDAGGAPRDALCVDGTNPDGDAGIVIAFAYEGYYSYSMKFLKAIQDAGYLDANVWGDYDQSTGTGGLDVLLYTRSAGQNNQDVGPTGDQNYDFEDPVVNPNVEAVEGYWGQNDADNDGTKDDLVPENGSEVTLQAVQDYLHAFDPDNETPVFFFDQNQTGTEPSLELSFVVRIIDPTTGTILAEFPLDALNNGTWDQTERALAFGEATFTGETLGEITVDHNLGSGKVDFAAVNADIILQELIDAYGADAWFVTGLDMAGLNDGGEELFLSGRVALIPPPPPGVPEPISLLTFATGLLAMAFLGRRRKGVIKA
ncbi:hypothetical protein GCM10027217_02830 [Pseudomaricurvus hydrocarbonicus]